MAIDKPVGLGYTPTHQGFSRRTSRGDFSN